MIEFYFTSKLMFIFEYSGISAHMKLYELHMKPRQSWKITMQFYKP